MFAIKGKVPVYPVMSLHKQRLFRRTKIIVGDAFELTEFYDRKLTAEDYAEAENIIREKMLATRRDYLQAEERRRQEKKSKRKR